METPETAPIDALGLVDVPPAARGAAPRQARVQEIDFRRPTKFPRDIVRRLEHAHDSFCRTASSGLSAELRTSFELAVAGSEQLPYGTAMAEANQDALLVILAVSPLETEVALLLEMPLALRLVDRLLGGGVKFDEQVASGLTDLEVVILRRAVESIVEPLSATWLDLADVSFSVSSIQTSPMTFQLVPPSEPMLILVLEARVDGLVSPLSLCIPYRSVETVLTKLEHRHAGADSADPVSVGKMRAAMAEVEVELRAVVGEVALPVGEVLELSVGDVVRLRRRADRGVVLHAGEIATYVAMPGRNGNSRAVQIRGQWTREL